MAARVRVGPSSSLDVREVPNFYLNPNSRCRIIGNSPARGKSSIRDGYQSFGTVQRGAPTSISFPAFSCSRTLEVELSVRHKIGSSVGLLGKCRKNRWISYVREWVRPRINRARWPSTPFGRASFEVIVAPLEPVGSESISCKSPSLKLERIDGKATCFAFSKRGRARQKWSHQNNLPYERGYYVLEMGWCHFRLYNELASWRSACRYSSTCLVLKLEPTRATCDLVDVRPAPWGLLTLFFVQLERLVENPSEYEDGYLIRSDEIHYPLISVHPHSLMLETVSWCLVATVAASPSQLIRFDESTTLQDWKRFDLALIILLSTLTYNLFMQSINLMKILQIAMPRYGRLYHHIIQYILLILYSSSCQSAFNHEIIGQREPGEATNSLIQASGLIANYNQTTTSNDLTPTHPIQDVNNQSTKSASIEPNNEKSILGNLTTQIKQSDNSTTTPPDENTAVMKGAIIANTIILIIGLCGNLVVILVILKFTKFETVTDIYILNLAFADLMFILGLIFLITTMLVGHWIFGNTMCKVSFCTDQSWTRQLIGLTN